jgi:hypothetical protein
LNNSFRKNTLINLFLIPTWEDTDNIHSDNIAIPKTNYTKTSDLYVMTTKDVENWNGKIYWSSVYVDWEKKIISQEQITKLKAHEKYIELPLK